MIVVGLDLSLRASGVAVLYREPLHGDWAARLRIVGGVGVPRTFTGCGRRLIDVTDGILRSVPRRADLAVVEGASYRSIGGRADERAGLRWLVTTGLMQRGVPVASVTPRTRARYATGTGSASKDVVVESVQGRYPWAGVRTDDEADALALAALGMRWLGDPAEAWLGDWMDECVAAAEWPEQLVMNRGVGE